MNSVVEGLFSFKGRMPRGEAWLLLVGMSFAAGGLLLVGSMGVLIIVPGSDAAAWAPLHRAAQRLLQLATLWPTLAILSKRGHDRNRPVPFTIGLWILSHALTVASGLAMLVGEATWLVFGTLAIWLYFLVDYGILDGTPGPNRFGPSPKGPSTRPYQKVEFGPPDAT